MNENPESPVTQAAMDDALDPDVFSGAELRALKKLDEKNLDSGDFAEMLVVALAAYRQKRDA